jgi:hypothetical protein
VTSIPRNKTTKFASFLVHTYFLAAALAWPCHLFAIDENDGKEPITSASVAEPRDLAGTNAVLRYGGFNLASAPWFVANALPPGALPEQIALEGTTISLSQLGIASNTEKSFRLFCILYLEFTPETPALLTIGGLPRRGQVYVNGMPLLSPLEEARPKSAFGRQYLIATKHLQKGSNTVCVELPESLGHIPDAPVILEPAVLQFLPDGSYTAAPVLVLGPAVVSGTSMGITCSIGSLLQKYKLVVGAAGEDFVRLPKSWGRFASAVSDGLPAVEMVNPTGMRQTYGPNLEILLDQVVEGQALTLEQSGGFSKHVEVKCRVDDSISTYRASWSMLYPGMQILLGENSLLRVKLSQGSHDLSLITMDGVVTQNASDKKSESLRLYLCMARKKSASPLIVASENIDWNIAQSEGGIELSLKTGQTSGKLRAFYPHGFRGYDFRLDAALHDDVILQKIMSVIANADGISTEAIRQSWLSMAEHFPVHAERWLGPVENGACVFDVVVWEKLYKGGLISSSLPRTPVAPLEDGFIEYSDNFRDSEALRTLATSGEIKWLRGEEVDSQSAGVDTNHIITAVVGKFRPLSLAPVIYPDIEDAPVRLRAILEKGLRSAIESRSVTTSHYGYVWDYFIPKELREQLSRSMQEHYAINPITDECSGHESDYAEDGLLGVAFDKSAIQWGRGEEPDELILNSGRLMRRVAQCWHLALGDFDSSAPAAERDSRVFRGNLADDWEWLTPAASARGRRSGSIGNAIKHLGDLLLIQQQAAATSQDLGRLLLNYEIARVAHGIVKRIRPCPDCPAILELLEGAPPVVMDKSERTLQYVRESVFAKSPLALDFLIRAYPAVVKAFLTSLSEYGPIIVGDSDKDSPQRTVKADVLYDRIAIRARLEGDPANLLLKKIDEVTEFNPQAGHSGAMLDAVRQAVMRTSPQIKMVSLTDGVVQKFTVSSSNSEIQERKVLIILESLGPNKSAKFTVVSDLEIANIRLNGGPVPLTDYSRSGNAHNFTIRRNGISEIEFTIK